MESNLVEKFQFSRLSSQDSAASNIAAADSVDGRSLSMTGDDPLVDTQEKKQNEKKEEQDDENDEEQEEVDRVEVESSKDGSPQV